MQSLFTYGKILSKNEVRSEMAMHVLYNPLANNMHGAQSAAKIKQTIDRDNMTFEDITQIDDITDYILSLDDNEIVIAGGDGTLNRFINNFENWDITDKCIYYYPAGSGNDFMRDVQSASENGLIRLNDYVKQLPVVTVKGREYRFINGVGYGIDGYCTQAGDELRAKSDKPINYTRIAIKGLLYDYHPVNASVTVDNVTRTYKKVWLAPTMNGRYYGGGMDVAPMQNRLEENKKVSTVIMYGSGKLKTLRVFPSIFKGEHIEHKEMVDVLRGNSVTVEFDRPCALQIDGETIPNVTSYSVKLYNEM